MSVYLGVSLGKFINRALCVTRIALHRVNPTANPGFLCLQAEEAGRCLQSAHCINTAPELMTKDDERFCQAVRAPACLQWCWAAKPRSQAARHVYVHEHVRVATSGTQLPP